MRAAWPWIGGIVTVLALGGVPALAADASAPPARGYVAGSGGVFNLGKDPKLAEGGIEYRRPLGHYGLRLAFGFAGTEEGSLWGWVGVQRPLPMGRLRLIPGLGVGLYEEGDGKDLGGPVEFRSSIEAAYELGNGTRLGLVFYHLSNAGLYDPNPGSNSLALIVSFPLR